MRIETQTQKLIAWLDQWQGSNASINNYNDDFERLVLALRRPDGDSIGISLFHPLYISGPFSWDNCHLILTYSRPENESGLEFTLADETARFVVRFGGPISVGDGNFVVPSD